MTKHIWFSVQDTEKVRISPYTDIKADDTGIILIRSDIRTTTSIRCSNQAVFNQLYKMLINGYSPDETSSLLEDETICAWLDTCIKKGVIE